MTIASVVILIGLLMGAVAGGLVAVRSAPDLDDPHVSRRTLRGAAEEHAAVRWIAQAAPRSASSAVASGLAISALIVVVTAALAGATLLMIRTDSLLARVDVPIAEWAADDATDASTTLMRELSKFGGTLYVALGTVGIAVYCWFRERTQAAFTFISVSMIGQFLVSNSIKWAVDRARPALSNLTGYSGTSFPSGHAVAGAAVWVSVAFLLGRGRSRTARGLLFGTAVTIGAIVAGTRVALGVHWTTDVIVGAIIGWSWFAICAVLFGGQRLEVTDPLEAAAGLDGHDQTSETPR